MTERSLQASLVEYLSALSLDEDAKEAVDVAVDTLVQAFALTPAERKAALPNGVTLLQVFTAGLSAINSQDSVASRSFDKFLETAIAKGYFNGVAEGTPEYAERLETARAKFMAKYSAGSAGSGAGSSAPSAGVSAADKARGEALKAEGNALLGQGQHEAAAAKYAEAIQANPTEPVYHSNRAAALVTLRRFDEAIQDSKKAIQLDPTYPKAHYRLGQALFHLGRFREALPAYEDAKRTCKEPSMLANIEAALAQTRARLAPPPAQAQAQSRPPMPAGMPDLSSLAGGLGGMDLGALFKDPAAMQMMAGLAQQFMGGAGGAGGAGATPAPTASGAASGAASAPGGAAPSSRPPVNPQIESLLQSPAIAALRSDPDLAPIIEDVEQNGAQAAFKYLGNPAVMAKLGPLVNALMGGMGAGGAGGAGAGI